VSESDESRVVSNVILGSAIVGTWSDYSTDKFMTPEMSKFTAAEIRDMSRVDSEQDHWQANYILNTVLRATPTTPYRQRYFNFLRRTHSAFSEYAQARESTLIFPARSETDTKISGRYRPLGGVSGLLMAGLQTPS
jgi:hypothetical protein